MMKKLILVILLLSAQLFAVASHAALFDDAEARKKILEVEAVMQSQNQSSQATLAKLLQSQQALEQRVLAIEAITKGQVLGDMMNQIEALKQDVARLKGQLEIASHNLDATQQRQKDLYTDTDARLRKLESSPVTAAVAAAVEAAPPLESATAAPIKNTQEIQLLELANGLSKESKFKDSFIAYDKFLKEYPNSALAADAMYSLGYTQFALKNYKSAIATQQKLIDQHPDSPKVPEALFNLANSQIQLGLIANAKKTLHNLIDKFPNSEVTAVAKKRLKVLESIK